jgi:hypothetical protein
LNFYEKSFLVKLALFAIFEAKRALNGSKNEENILQMRLRIQFCIHDSYRGPHSTFSKKDVQIAVP